MIQDTLEQDDEEELEEEAEAEVDKVLAELTDGIQLFIQVYWEKQEMLEKNYPNRKKKMPSRHVSRPFNLYEVY